MGTPAASESALSLYEYSSSRFSRQGIVVLLCVLLFVGLCAAPRLAAKQKAPTTKTVTGQVMDQGETGIGGAAVMLKDVQTGKTRAIYANDNGEYKFADLDPHHDYEISAGYKGANSESRRVSSVDTRTKLVINLTVPSAKP